MGEHFEHSVGPWRSADESAETRIKDAEEQLRRVLSVDYKMSEYIADARARNALFEGIDLKAFTPEHYVDQGEARVRILGADQKPLFDGSEEDFEQLHLRHERERKDNRLFDQAHET